MEINSVRFIWFDTEKRKGMKNECKGITLITLVVTIVVLLILAGTTIGIVSNNNGIIEQTEESKSNVERESLIQKINADIFAEKTKKGRELNQDEIKVVLEKYGTINYESDDITVNGITSNNGNYEILLSEIIQ